METIKTIMYENGNTYNVEVCRCETIELGKKYIDIDGKQYELLSKVRTNEVTITDEMSLDVLPGLDNSTKESLKLTPMLIDKLKNYTDEYSQNLVKLFVSYYYDHDFEKMYKGFGELNPKDSKKMRDRWDLNLRMLLSEVVYPA